MLPSPRSAPSCRRFGLVQAPPALYPCESRRPHDEIQPVPCGARTETRLQSASSSQRQFPPIRAVPKYITGLNVDSRAKTDFTYL